MLRDLPVQDIMSKPAIVVEVDDPFHLVHEKFQTKDIRHLPVVNAEKKLVGLMTRTDLYRTISPRKTPDGYQYNPRTLDEFILQRVMTENPTSVSPLTPLSVATEIMARNKYGCLPVVDGQNKVVGIVTETDIFKLVAKKL
jgi:CBS domain-containing protein